MPEENEVAVETEQRKPENPLCYKAIRAIGTWYEWSKEWKSAETVHEMISLLHIGYEMSIWDRNYGEPALFPADRFIFYFNIADGWSNKDLLVVKGENIASYPFGYDNDGRRVDKNTIEIRQMIARKAMDMLLKNFFKAAEFDNRSGQFINGWAPTIQSAQLFSCILNFFRVEKSCYDRLVVRNYQNSWGTTSIEREEIEQFLVNLAIYLWRWEKSGSRWTPSEEEEKHNHDVNSRFDAAKPWMIEILSALDRLDIIRQWLLTLDEQCLAKLKEIALRNEISNWSHLVEEDRPVATIEEACFAGSAAGWLLKEYELKSGVRAHLVKVLETKRRKKELEQELTELESQKVSE